MGNRKYGHARYNLPPEVHVTETRGRRHDRVTDQRCKPYSNKTRRFRSHNRYTSPVPTKRTVNGRPYQPSLLDARSLLSPVSRSRNLNRGLGRRIHDPSFLPPSHLTRI